MATLELFQRATAEKNIGDRETVEDELVVIVAARQEVQLLWKGSRVAF